MTLSYAIRLSYLLMFCKDQFKYFSSQNLCLQLRLENFYTILHQRKQRFHKDRNKIENRPDLARVALRLAETRWI